MTLKDSYAAQLLSLFRYSDFRDRSETAVRSILSGNHPKSELPLLPKPDEIEVHALANEFATHVRFIWEDCEFNYTFSWKKGGKGNNYLLEDIV